MPEKKDSFSDLMGAGDNSRRRRRVAPTGPAAGKGPSGPAMQGPSGPAMQGPSGPAMQGPSGPAMQGPSGPAMRGAPDAGERRRRRRAGEDDLMKQLYG